MFFLFVSGTNFVLIGYFFQLYTHGWVCINLIFGRSYSFTVRFWNKSWENNLKKKKQEKKNSWKNKTKKKKPKTKTNEKNFLFVLIKESPLWVHGPYHYIAFGRGSIPSKMGVQIGYVLPLDNYHISRHIRRMIYKDIWETTTHCNTSKFHGCAKVGRPARTYIQQLCEDTGCNPEDLPEAMNDREKWRERVRDIRAGGATWWWWWLYRHRIILGGLVQGGTIELSS